MRFENVKIALEIFKTEEQIHSILEFWTHSCSESVKSPTALIFVIPT